jgi:ADP-heptose:LPS heptosyltransferase
MATATAERSRFAGRAQVVTRALFSRLGSGGRRSAPPNPRRILIAHHLLLGDTLMLTPLVAKLRERHPAADLVMALQEPYTCLYARAPYGVRAIGWNPRSPAASPLWRERDFDLAIVAGDNRFAWLALALGARWIVGFAGDRPAVKNWPLDEARDYPKQPAAWGDMVAGLVDGPPPAPYLPAAWPAPAAERIPGWPTGRYAVLHVGASSALKLWDSGRWAALASRFARHDIEPIWSAGRDEAEIVRACDPHGAHRSLAGMLSLPQLWHLLAGASALVSPDTSIAHLGRVIGTPTVALFGPGSATLTGAGSFWRNSPYRAVTVDPFPCRDQRVLFKREIEWVRRCGRSLAECSHPRCMDAIELEAVLAAAASLGIELR